MSESLPEKRAALGHADADAALRFVGNDVPEMTSNDEKRLIRKIDFFLIPLLFGCYFFQYLDKSLINYANIMGIEKDTHITGDQFSQLALVFYATSLAFEFPTGYLMQRFPTAKYLGLNVVCWGVVVACTSVAKDWGGLVTLRLLLGAFEAAVAPAGILLTAMWYKRAEQPPRIGFWYLGIAIAKIIGALASFGFQHYSGSAFHSWQLMFLIFGLLTTTLGIVIIFIVPDNPMTSRLSETEKIWAIERLRENKTGIENKHFKLEQVKECFIDPQTWLIFFATLASMIPNGFISTYQATVIKSFGFTSKVTSLMSIPSGGIEIVAILSSSWIAGRHNMRGPPILTLVTLGLVGSCMLAFLPEHSSNSAKLVGNYLAILPGTSLFLMYTYASANYAGHTKKVTINAIMLIGYCVGNVIGPLTFRDQDKPRYLPAKIALIVAAAFYALCISVLMAYYRWENRRRNRLGTVEHVENSEFFDLTDRQNLEFRVSTALDTV